jgi:hypothetical protein
VLVVLIVEEAYKAIQKSEDQYEKIYEKYHSPDIDVRIDEVHIMPTDVGGNFFVSCTLHNINPEIPTTIERCFLEINVSGKMYQADPEKAENLIDWQINRSERYGGKYWAVDSENLWPVMSRVTDLMPLKRGIPQSGWIRFYASTIPRWPTRTAMESENVGHGYWDTSSIRKVTLVVVDPFGREHRGWSVPPFPRIGLVHIRGTVTKQQLL